MLISKTRKVGLAMILFESTKFQWKWPFFRKEFTLLDFEADPYAYYDEIEYREVWYGPFPTEEAARTAMRFMLSC